MLGLRGQPLRLGGRRRAAPDRRARAACASRAWISSSRASSRSTGRESRARRRALRSAMEHAALADLLACTDWGEPRRARRRSRAGRRSPARVRAVAAAAAWPRSPSRFRPRSRCSPSSARCGARYAARVPLIGLVENFASVVCATLRRRRSALPRGLGRASRARPRRRRGGAHPVRCQARAGRRCGPRLLRGRRRGVRGRARARGARRARAGLRAAGSGGGCMVKRTLARSAARARARARGARGRRRAARRRAEGWAYDLHERADEPLLPRPPARRLPEPAGRRPCACG